MWEERNSDLAAPSPTFRRFRVQTDGGHFYWPGGKPRIIRHSSLTKRQLGASELSRQPAVALAHPAIKSYNGLPTQHL